MMGETLLHIPAIRQYQLSPRPGGLLVRVVLRDATPREEALQSAKQRLEAELDRVGAIVETPRVEAVDHIARTGTGAKEKVVSPA